MNKYSIERSNISYNNDHKSMICTFTITHIESQEKFVFNNIYLAEDNKEAYLVFPTTNEKVYLNEKPQMQYIEQKYCNQSVN